MRCSYSEGRAWIGRLLDASAEGERGEAHAMALHSASSLAYMQNDCAAAEMQSQEALALWVRLGDRKQTMRSLGALGDVAMERGQQAAARSLFQQALAIAREIGDRRGTAMGLYCLGRLACDAGELEAAHAFYEESISNSGDVASDMSLHARCELGTIRCLRGDIPGARALLTEALEQYRALGFQMWIAVALAWLGIMSHDEGDIAAARSQLGEGLTLLHAIGARGSIALPLEAFASLSSALAGPPEAARLFGAAERLREDIELPLTVVERDRYERHVAAVRSAMRDDAMFAAAWAEGRAWTLDEAVRYALSL
jgi:tetratricopeptide (TPR) repeat protein